MKYNRRISHHGNESIFIYHCKNCKNSSSSEQFLMFSDPSSKYGKRQKFSILKSSSDVGTGIVLSAPPRTSVNDDPAVFVKLRMKLFFLIRDPSYVSPHMSFPAASDSHFPHSIISFFTTQK